MAKSIAGLFDRRGDAEGAAQDLLDQGIAPERISVIAGGARDTTGQEEQVEADEATGAVAVGSLAGGLAGLTAFALPGIGMILAAGPLVGALSIAMAAAEEDDVSPRLHRVLLSAGLMEEQVSTYAEGIRQGRTLVAVSADDDQTDFVADVLRRHGGARLDFRQREA